MAAGSSTSCSCPPGSPCCFSARARSRSTGCCSGSESFGVAFITAEGMMTGTWHWFSARAALVVACVAAPIAANADTHRTPVGHTPEGSTADREKAEREWMYATIHRRFAATHAIPAFARKYGMKCSACHLAVPVLNQFGQAFKDNGYRMKNGTDDLRANEPAYWPLFGWLWKNYEVDVQRVGGRAGAEPGGLSNGGGGLGGVGPGGAQVSVPQPGVEIMGHDLGSRNRYSVNLFNTGGAPRAHCVFCSPGIFGRVTHRQEFATGFLRAVRAGVFGAYATWPVGPDTSDLKGQQRLGGDVELWLGSDVLPLRATLMAMTGREDPAPVPAAPQDPKFNTGMLQRED